ncbi:MAG: carbohydrate ABC transporter permease [Ruminococcaceae bacterium]|nr:carbohydrate ABC transporter permease [Oscillospiraceae bacterium]
MAKKTPRIGKKYTVGSTILTAFFTVLCLVWLIPIIEVFINAFKHNNAINLDAFALPTKETFVGFANFVKGFTFGNYPFVKSLLYSLIITVSSVALILLFCSMTAWYIARVGSVFSKIFYYLCLFSMIVPFQMVMFALSYTVDRLGLNTPYTIPVVYLGFGAGLAIFMFVGFVKGIPLDIEEAASIDGCGPVRTYFKVVLPMLKPTLISVGILELMWVWNDYLLPYLVLDINEYRTIPIHVQYLKGSYGTVDLGATMAIILMSILPIIIVYMFCQKHIIKGVAAGAVKG